MDVSASSAAHAGVGSVSVERHSHSAFGDAPIVQAADDRGGNIFRLPAGQAWDTQQLVNTIPGIEDGKALRSLCIGTSCDDLSAPMDNVGYALNERLPDLIGHIFLDALPVSLDRFPVDHKVFGDLVIRQVFSSYLAQLQSAGSPPRLSSAEFWG